MTVHTWSEQCNNFGPEHGRDGWNHKIVFEGWQGQVQSLPVWRDYRTIADPLPDRPASLQTGVPFDDELFVSVVVGLGAGGLIDDPPTLGELNPAFPGWDVYDPDPDVHGFIDEYPNAAGLVVHVALTEIRYGWDVYTGPRENRGNGPVTLTLDGVDAFPYRPEWETKVRGSNHGATLRCVVTALTGSAVTLEPVQLKIPI